MSSLICIYFNRVYYFFDLAELKLQLIHKIWIDFLDDKVNLTP
jgi:hypothetical protein